jgi:prepilin-type N-terminal cleavage/methylation domain-containing protein
MQHTSRKAFTLIELILSVFLLGIIVYFLYAAVANLQKSNEIFSKKSQSAFYNQKILSMLQKDLFFASEIKLEGHENTLVNLQTTNSLFNIDYPYVTWLLKPDLHKLVRFESTLPFTKMNAKNNPYYHMSIIPKECELFKIYQSKKKENILIYIKFKGEEPLVYEFFKPLQPVDLNKSKKKPKIIPPAPHQ